jgi:hypothetical protein
MLITVAVLDERAEISTAERFPQVDVLLSGLPDEHLVNRPLTEPTCATLVTAHHPRDEKALAVLAERAIPCTGLFGRRRSTQATFERVRANGAPDESPSSGTRAHRTRHRRGDTSRDGHEYSRPRIWPCNASKEARRRSTSLAPCLEDQASRGPLPACEPCARHYGPRRTRPIGGSGPKHDRTSAAG